MATAATKQQQSTPANAATRAVTDDMGMRTLESVSARRRFGALGSGGGGGGGPEGSGGSDGGPEGSGGSGGGGGGGSGGDDGGRKGDGDGE